MANVVYGDPFGSYVRGQEQGQKQAIDLATAQRSFRDSDVNAEYLKWYLPHKQDEVRRKEESEKLAFNQAYFKNLALLASTGNPIAVQHAVDFLKQAFPGTEIDEKDPMKVAQMLNTMSGSYPAAFNLDPKIYAAQGYGKLPDFGSLTQPGAVSLGDPIRKRMLELYGPDGTGTPGAQKPIDLKPPSAETKTEEHDIFGDPIPQTTPAPATTSPAADVRQFANVLNPNTNAPSGNPPWQVPNYNFQPGANPEVAEHSPAVQYHQDLGEGPAQTYGKPTPVFKSGFEGGSAPISIPKAVTTAPVNAPTAGAGFYGGGGNEGLVKKVQPANKRMAVQ